MSPTASSAKTVLIFAVSALIATPAVACRELPPIGRLWNRFLKKFLFDMVEI